jgi:ABC-type enterochelin transport system ATPase subunit
MIEIRGISKSFNDHEVLNEINLKIPDKKISGLIGINGAGKSTLLRVISRIYSTDDGVVLVDYSNYLLCHKLNYMYSHLKWIHLKSYSLYYIHKELFYLF